MSLSALAVAAAVAVLAGSALQSAIGFGFALVCAPVLFAAAGPEEAIGLVTLLGLEVNLLTLAGERRRPQPLGRDVLTILVFAVPGLVAGVLVLRAVDEAALQVAVTAAVVAGLGVQRLALRRGPARVPPWAPPLAGLASGGLATSTGASGPPLVLLLLQRAAPPAQVRDTLTASFLGLGVLAFAVLMATGTTAAVPDPLGLALLAVCVLAGHLAGRRVFARLARGGYEPVLAAVLFLSAATGLVATFA